MTRWFGRIRCSTLGIVLLGSVIGCARFDRVEQCQALAATVNGTLDEVEALAIPKDAGADADVVSKAESVARYREMSKLYLRLSGELGAFTVRDERLAKHVGQYAQLMKRTARAVDRLADASAGANATVAQVAVNEIRHLRDRQRATSQQIDRLCLQP
jgi:hypothetical protein